jgi:SNF2 family DNA or RNA helicase
MSNETLREDIAQKALVNPGSHTTMIHYHAKYFAYELTKRCPSDSAEKLAGALVDAQVDLNPHQIEASLFAFRSPLSRGALLADEVGLGKTIEAGLVLSQKWAERKRRILVITPSNLRKQWYQELTEKFFLLSVLKIPSEAVF